MNTLRVYCLLFLVACVLSGCATFQGSSSTEIGTYPETYWLTPQLLQGSYGSQDF